MSQPAARLAAFARVGRNRPLRRSLAAFFGFSLSEYGSWIAVLVYALGAGSATTVGLVAVAQLVPAAVLAAPLARLLDRHSRAGAAAVAYTAQAATMAATATAMLVEAPLWVTVALATTTTIAVTTGRPVHNSVVPVLAADPEELTAANVVTTTIEGAGAFAGPALAGVVMGLASPGAALGVLAAVLVAAALSVVSIGPAPATVSHPTPDEDDPARASLHRRRVAPFVMVHMAQAVVMGAMDVLVVLLAVEVLGAGEAGAGFLNASLGLGIIVGGLAAAALVGRPHLTQGIVVGGLARTACLVLLAVVPPAPLWLVGLGAALGLVDVANRTLLQRSVPLPALGRAFGALEASAMGALAAGALLAPALAAWVGTRGAFAALALVPPIVLTVAWRSLRQADQRATVPEARLAVIERTAMFAGLSPATQEALARGARFAAVATGTVVVREGERGDRMWIVDMGQVEVRRNGRLLATLGAGDLFGEIALMHDTTRIATVTAVEPGRLLVIDRSHFFDAMATSPGTRTAFEVMAATRSDDALRD